VRASKPPPLCTLLNHCCIVGVHTSNERAITSDALPDHAQLHEKKENADNPFRPTRLLIRRSSSFLCALPYRSCPLPSSSSQSFSSPKPSQYPIDKYLVTVSFYWMTRDRCLNIRRSSPIQTGNSCILKVLHFYSISSNAHLRHLLRRRPQHMLGLWRRYLTLLQQHAVRRLRLGVLRHCNVRLFIPSLVKKANCCLSCDGNDEFSVTSYDTGEETVAEFIDLGCESEATEETSGPSEKLNCAIGLDFNVFNFSFSILWSRKRWLRNRCWLHDLRRARQDVHRLFR